MRANAMDTQHKANFSLASNVVQGLSMEQERIAVSVNGLDLYYSEKRALNGINMQIARNRVTAFIGPSGCGKSTLLRCFNRMNDLVDLLSPSFAAPVPSFCFRSRS